MKSSKDECKGMPSNNLKDWIIWLGDEHRVPPKCLNMHSALIEINGKNAEDGDDIVSCLSSIIDDEVKDAKSD